MAGSIPPWAPKAMAGAGATILPGDAKGAGSTPALELRLGALATSSGRVWVQSPKRP